MKLTEELLMKYVMHLIGSGIVQMKREWMYTKFPKKLKKWISLNPVLSQLELQQCKKFFTGRMMEMTKMFNDVAKKLWNPSQ